ncbi:MAG: Crp/Fnr family transcriptional regulator [Bacteroidales bacterium]|nr:Crp/Fnr family transcriptional regulator [Bacteroidales bacterium]
MMIRPIKCRDCDVVSKTIIKNLSDEEKDKLDLDKACNLYKRGAIVYHEGNRLSGIFCVNSGIVKLFKTGVEGREQIIRFAKEGDVIGYRSILSEEVACTSAKVVEDAILCFIPSDKLFNLLKKNSDFSLELLHMACKELGESNSFLAEIAQKSVRERLAEALLLLKTNFGADENGYLKINLTREELANLIGTATESVIRLLSEFKDDNFIEIQGRKIKLIDLAGLKRTANLF